MTERAQGLLPSFQWFLLSRRSRKQGQQLSEDGTGVQGGGVGRDPKVSPVQGQPLHPTHLHPMPGTAGSGWLSPGCVKGGWPGAEGAEGVPGG